MTVATEEGLLRQLQYLLAYYFRPTAISLGLGFTANRLSETMTFGSITQYPFQFGTGTTLAINPGDWSFAGPPGSCTASVGSHTFTVDNNNPTITLNTWLMWDPDDDTSLWLGSMSPAWTPGVGVGLSYVMGPLTVTLGNCTPPPPPPATTLLLDTFAGSGTTTIDGRSPNVGGPWHLVNGALEVHDGICDSSFVGISIALVPGATVPLTLTAGYVHGSNTNPGFALLYTNGANGLVFRGSGGFAQLEQLSSFVSTIPAQGLAPLVDGDTYTLTCQLTSDSFTLAVGGVSTVTLNGYNSGLGGTSFGLFWQQSSASDVGHLFSLEVTTP